ncbi:MAG TPA: flavin reductase family protein [Ktedonobacteraceae bacterium]
MSLEQVKFRKALSHFASGVTVITTQHLGQYHGTTVSSFCSLSLKPALVLVCLDLKSTSHDLVAESGIFGVNILAEQDEWISSHFARRTPDKFSDVSYHLGQVGVPLLDNALATLECHVSSRYPGGDHSIFIGEVISTSVESDREPLLYFRSKYSRLEISPVNLAVGS